MRRFNSAPFGGEGSPCRLLFSARSQEGSVCRHETGQHRCDQFRGFDGLPRLAAEHFGIRHEITMDTGRQLDAELDRLIVGTAESLSFSIAVLQLW